MISTTRVAWPIKTALGMAWGSVHHVMANRRTLCGHDVPKRVTIDDLDSLIPCAICENKLARYEAIAAGLPMPKPKQKRMSREWLAEHVAKFQAAGGRITKLQAEREAYEAGPLYVNVKGPGGSV